LEVNQRLTCNYPFIPINHGFQFELIRFRPDRDLIFRTTTKF
jgi:hypothetical protein